MRRYRLYIAVLLAFLANLALAQPAPQVRGMDFDTYVRLNRGMTEGELILRAGPPDYAAFENLAGFVKSFYYYPTASAPFLTVVTLRGGRIHHIERTKIY